MIPVLFRIPAFKLFGTQIGPITINSFGLMLGLSALVGSYILGRELPKRKINPQIAGTVTVVGLLTGIIGAKILHLIENWEMFVAKPLTAFSPSGLTWYGGFALGILSVILYVKSKGIPVLRFLDALGVALVVAYGVGRIGCHLAGDGDYGVPTTLPWGTIYAQGTAKPSEMLQEFFDRNPDEREFWKYDSLRTILAGVDDLGRPYFKFDELTPCHPTPVYELLLGIIGYAFLITLWRPGFPDGALFMVYLLIASVFRFTVEFLRLQPKLVLGLSEAQLIGIGLFFFGVIGLLLITSQERSKNTSSQ